MEVHMLWQRLYTVIWLSFFECLLVQRWFSTWVVLVLHVALGVAILVLTQVNAAELAKKAVPARLKRISRATANIAIAQAVLGAGVGALMHFSLPSWVGTLAAGVHLALALTILAQAGSTATAYDMFEEKEFGPEK
jgi:hypothetical protein